jgi:hypothetical protein
VDGRSEQLPPELCLRAWILAGIRCFNTELNKDARIRIHLTDIDAAATTIATITPIALKYAIGSRLLIP